jgi:hypothetical protein
MQFNRWSCRGERRSVSTRSDSNAAPKHSVGNKAFRDGKEGGAQATALETCKRDQAAENQSGHSRRAEISGAKISRADTRSSPSKPRGSASKFVSRRPARRNVFAMSVDVCRATRAFRVRCGGGWSSPLPHPRHWRAQWERPSGSRNLLRRQCDWRRYILRRRWGTINTSRWWGVSFVRSTSVRIGPSWVDA